MKSYFEIEALDVDEVAVVLGHEAVLHVIEARDLDEEDEGFLRELAVFPVEAFIDGKNVISLAGDRFTSEIEKKLQNLGDDREGQRKFLEVWLKISQKHHYTTCRHINLAFERAKNRNQ